MITGVDVLLCDFQNISICVFMQEHTHTHTHDKVSGHNGAAVPAWRDQLYLVVTVTGMARVGCSGRALMEWVRGTQDVLTI